MNLALGTLDLLTNTAAKDSLTAISILALISGLVAAWLGSQM